MNVNVCVEMDRDIVVEEERREGEYLTVMRGHRLSCWVQTPMPRRMREMSLRVLFPRMRASPEVGWVRPVRMEMVVLFPAPLGPRKVKKTPDASITVAAAINWGGAFIPRRPSFCRAEVLKSEATRGHEGSRERKK